MPSEISLKAAHKIEALVAAFYSGRKPKYSDVQIAEIIDQAADEKYRAALERCVTELGYILESPKPELIRTAETEDAWKQGTKALTAVRQALN